jgi:hypothetical protein
MFRADEVTLRSGNSGQTGLVIERGGKERATQGGGSVGFACAAAVKVSRHRPEAHQLPRLLYAIRIRKAEIIGSEL